MSEHPEDKTLGDIMFRMRDDLDKAREQIWELEERVRAMHVELAMHKFCLVGVQERIGHPWILPPESGLPNREKKKIDTNKGDF